MFKELPGSQPFHSIRGSGNFGACTLHISEEGLLPQEQQAGEDQHRGTACFLLAVFKRKESIDDCRS